jgi:hypothetical protein
VSESERRSWSLDRWMSWYRSESWSMSGSRERSRSETNNQHKSFSESRDRRW